MLRHFLARWFVIPFLMCSVLTGCKVSTEGLYGDLKHFELKGTVVATDPQNGQITLQHEAIPGFMEAMTMPYPVQPKQAVTELHAGDRIHARLSVEKTPDGDYRKPFIDEIAVIAQAKPSFKPPTQYHVPTEGDPVPDFHLVNQDRKPIHLDQFRGKALLITFIYTRCPLGDFCPKMSRNFEEIDTRLRADKAAYAHTALLSISFDPVYDTPAVLRAYGTAYTGTQGFGHWQFAVADKDALQQMEHFFNLGVTLDENTIQHSLSTVLIDPSGKIASWYPGSEWSADEVVTKMKSLTETKTPADEKHS